MFILLQSCLVSGYSPCPDPDYYLVVNLDTMGPQVSPILYGVFFEDINHSVDGGLYAELVRNRSFEHPNQLEGWLIEPDNSTLITATVETANPLNENNPHYLKLITQRAESGIRIINIGYDGIPVKEEQQYFFSMYARIETQTSVPVRISIEDAKGNVCADGWLEIVGNQWQKYRLRLSAHRDCRDTRLVIRPQFQGGPCILCLDMVSLFPCDAWNGIMRSDLVEMLSDLRPGFLRFPGGCLVEGYSLSNAYRWKDTVGPVENRKTNVNLWGYHQSYGIGFHEYFLLAKYLDAEPVPVLNAGISCQVRGAQFAPMNEMKNWVQDALDLIEYANGPATSGWGSKRAANGHEEPFNLKYLGIGNENWGEEYQRRFKLFQEAIKATYPEIKLIFSCPPEYQGPAFDQAWRWARNNEVDLVDEHIYASPEWFLANSDRYDSYDRQGPKVMVGEYAAHVTGRRNNLQAALAEAAFMTGLERNSDVVHMASYAPLFNRMGWSQWVPDLIWFNDKQVYGTPSYYVQKMFSTNRADIVLPSGLFTHEGYAGHPINGKVGLGTWRTQVEFDYIKVTDKDGRVLLHEEFTKDKGAWEVYRGVWRAKNGLISQTSLGEDTRIYFGDTSWSNYTVEIRGRKIGGAEGLLILFGVKDNQNYYWWNLGGWGNTVSAIEKAINGQRMILGKSVSLNISQDEWYRIKIEVSNNEIRCYLNDKLIHKVVDQITYKPLYHVCGYDYETKDIILKVVNPWSDDKEVQIQLKGDIELTGDGYVTILTSNDLRDENSFPNPLKVSPIESTLPVGQKSFTYTFKRYSVTVVRIRTRGL